MAHLSLKQRSPLRNSFIPSRRQSRQTDSVYRAKNETSSIPLFCFTSFLPAGIEEPVYGRPTDPRSVTGRGQTPSGSDPICTYTRRRFLGRQPLCGIGVESLMDLMSMPFA